MKLVKGTKMPDFTYLSPYAEGPQSFEAFADGKKTYVVFLRYYGCTVCRLDLHIFAQRMAEFAAKDCKLMVVLQSDPNLVKDEAPLGTFPYEIACDPAQEVYKKFDIEPAKSMLALIGGGLFKALKKMKAAKGFGFEHGEYEGNEQQLPALVLVDEHGIITYSHYAKNLADMPSVDEMLANI
ncbi:MAG: redoxin domain-containing protein [Oscillospiraceae bacterium]|nr:redoxin domain-containing protein [Oscillospiraceae bacterium]